MSLQAETPPEPPEPFDSTTLAEELNAVRARHGLAPAPGERIDGFVTLIRVTGYDEQGREYRRVYSYTSPGLSRVDVLDIIRGKLRMLARRRTPSAAR